MIARKHSYVPSLDGLRAVCIAAVIFFHVPMPAGHPWLQAVHSRCWYGVDMFFILSGFLITWILAVEFENTGKVDLAYFYRARSLRLLPAYFSALVLVFGAAYLSGIPRRQVKFFPPAKVWPLLLTYSLNLWIAATAIWPAGLSHFWSLCVEEHFYLSWSFVFRRWGISRALKIALAAIVVVAAYRSGLYLFMNWGHLASPSRASYYRIHYATDTRIDAILIGCALALLMREGRLERFWQFYAHDAAAAHTLADRGAGMYHLGHRVSMASNHLRVYRDGAGVEHGADGGFSAARMLDRTHSGNAPIGGNRPDLLRHLSVSCTVADCV